MTRAAERMISLFKPRRVAVVGASANPAKIGYKILENIIAGGYEGGIHPINPRGGEILGLASARSLRDLEPGIDLACVATPSETVYGIVKECADCSVANVVIITSGFSEIGKADEERRIAGLARERGVRILGPNVFGLYSSKSRLNATFGPKNVMPGRIAIISQSGAIGVAMIGKTAAEKVGLSAIVSVGNKSDIDEADLVEYFIEDEHTGIILMYIEGLKNGERFVEVVRRAARVKPVVVIKAGWSAKGAAAAASHTGSLAGSDAIFDSVMRQCGVIRAESVQEAFDWSVFLADAPMPGGEKCVIVTNGGGMGVMATDACEKYGVKLLDDAHVLKQTFSSAVPEFGSVKNPIDLTGGASEKAFAGALDAALGRDEIHSVVSLYCETAMLDEQELAKVIEEKFRRFRGRKPIAFSLFGGERLKIATEKLRAGGVPVFPDVYDAVSCLGALMRNYRFRHQGPEVYEESAVDLDKVRKVVSQVRTAGRKSLLVHEAQMLMKAAGIPMTGTAVAKNIEQVVRFAEEIGYPVVLKVVSQDILHKTDAGGVALDLASPDEVVEAYQAVLHNCRNYNKNAKIDGIQVSKMAPKGVETIVGARRDKVFGPIVMFGLGGIYVEVMKDVIFRSLPVSAREVSEMISSIRSYSLLLGVRGEGRKDIPMISETVRKVGALVRNCPEITDIEINPLVVYEQGQGCMAVDARILIDNPREGT